MDGVISQSDKSYLEALLNYSKILAQRNALLKYFALNNNFNKDSLDVYNEQLNDFGSVIHEKRKLFLNTFTPIFKKRYETISNNSESIDLQYNSQEWQYLQSMPGRTSIFFLKVAVFLFSE